MVFAMAHPARILFVPHPHNNHKPKILWTRSIFVLVGLYIMGRSIIDIVVGLRPGVLGFASRIDPEKIIELTNNQRLNAGAEIVKINNELNSAATAKVNDMFANNYWAHVSPTGTEPWYFITQSGYKYLHAGENLARDFSSADDIVKAWMASPTHRQNLLDKRYKEMGLAVKDGFINGVETTIVVQMFGVTQDTKAIGKIASSNISVEPVYASERQNEASGLSPLDLSRVWSLSFVIMILVALSLDWIFVLRYNLIRISGKAWAHLTFFAFVGIAVLIIKQGLVL